MSQYFELKEIRSEYDLPKEDGRYWVEIKGQADMEHWQYFTQYEDMQKVWMDKVHSYFSPVETCKEVVYIKSDEYQDTNLHIWSNQNNDWVPSIYLRKTESIIVKQ